MRCLFFRACVLSIILILTACSTLSAPPRPQAELPASDALWLHVHDAAHHQDSLLAVQISAGHQWRWVQTDAFGAPLARQIADQKGWRNDGFLPPNHRASHLFAAIVPIVAQLHGISSATVYPQIQTQQSGNSVIYGNRQHPLWRITTLNPQSWVIGLADGSQWQISILEQ